MSASGGTARGSAGVDRDIYEPEQQGVRNIAAQDGYDAGDGFERTNPQFWSGSSGASQSSYLPHGSASNSYAESYGRSARRPRSFDDYRQQQNDRYSSRDYGQNREYASGSRGRSAPRGRDPYPNDYSDSESDFDYSDDERNHRALERRRSSKDEKSSRGRSQSRLRQKIQDMFSSDESEMGKGNSESKKWAATLAGAFAGGLAGRTAKKDNWMPAAMGAFIGGLTAREAEKAFYVRKDTKEKEQKAWEEAGRA